jgi:hypothetical protein
LHGVGIQDTLPSFEGGGMIPSEGTLPWGDTPPSPSDPLPRRTLEGILRQRSQGALGSASRGLGRKGGGVSPSGKEYATSFFFDGGVLHYAVNRLTFRIKSCKFTVMMRTPTSSIFNQKFEGFALPVGLLQGAHSFFVGQLERV